MTERAQRIAAQALAASAAEETEVIISQSYSALTRFAGNTIHQNVAEENLTVTVRAVSEKRIGVASSNDVSKRGLKRVARAALEIARHQPPTLDFPGLPSPKPLREVEAFSRAAAAMTPAQRARASVKIIAPAAAAGATASGLVSQETGILAVANSRGVNAAARSSAFDVSAVVEKGSGAGYAGGVSWDPAKVDVARIGRTALDKCLASADPRAIDPAEYAVILEPQAVAELLSYTAYMGFGAQRFIEGTSFMSTRMGQKVMHDSVSVWDDGLDPRGMPVPFDYEGIPKERVPLIENGVAAGVVYDTRFGAKAGKESTGHALPPSFSGGPLPTNIVMAPGDSSIREMIASTDHGLVVTRFHYVNIADPANAVLTGLTRDGTFLVEKGRVIGPVRNLRFTESMLSAFSSVEAISRDPHLEPAMLGAALVPAVKMSAFRFTGATGF